MHTYLLRLSRPRFWLYLAGPVLVGVAYGAESVGDLASPATLALFAYFLVPANVLLYGVNDVFDRDVDATNPKKDGREVRFQGGRIVPLAVAIAAVLLVPVAGLVTARAWPWLLGWVALAVAYSAPPLRFKTVPLLDSVSNGLYVLPGVAAYVAVSGTRPPLPAILGGWLWTMGMHTFSAIPDVDPDRAAGIRTTATVLGERWAFGYCAAVWTLAALAFATIDPRLAVPFAGYPLLAVAIAVSTTSVDRAYWWFPAINALVGTVLTLGGLWGLLRA